MNTFFIAYKNQIKNNNIVTALEFLYPNHLENISKNNSSHFSAWEYISAMSELSLNKGFNTNGFLSVVNSFESSYSIKAKANIMSCNYNSIKEMKDYCVKNDYAVVTSNDFFYPKNGELVSINGNEIEGNFLLLEQSK